MGDYLGDWVYPIRQNPLFLRRFALRMVHALRTKPDFWLFLTSLEPDFLTPLRAWAE